MSSNQLLQNPNLVEEINSEFDNSLNKENNSIDPILNKVERFFNLTKFINPSEEKEEEKENLQQTILCLDHLLNKSNLNEKISNGLEKSLDENSEFQTIINDQQIELFKSYSKTLELIQKGVDELDTLVDEFQIELNGMDMALQPVRKDNHELADLLMEVDHQSFRLKNQSDLTSKLLSEYWVPNEDIELIENLKEGCTLDIPILNSMSRILLANHKINSSTLPIEHASSPLMNDLRSIMSNLLPALISHVTFYLKAQLPIMSHHPDLLILSDTFRRSLNLGLKLKVGDSFVNEMIGLRKRFWVEGFGMALTEGKWLVGVKPMDLRASEPVRYLGDVLAWAHAAAAEEKEFLTSLFNIDQIESDIFDLDINQLIINTLDLIIAQLGPPLISKLESIYHTISDPLTAYQLITHLKFHTTLITRILNHPQPQLSLQLTQLHHTLYEEFISLLSDWNAQHLASADVPTQDLSVPNSVRKGMDQLMGMIQTQRQSQPYKQTQTSNDDIDQSDQAQFSNDVIDPLLTGLIQVCERESSYLSSLHQPIYIINCLYFMMESLLPYDTQHQITGLNNTIETNKDILITHQHGLLLELTGLIPLLDLANLYHTEMKQQLLMSTPDLDSLNPILSDHTDIIHRSLNQLDTFLYTVDIDLDLTFQENNLPLSKLIINSMSLEIRVEAINKWLDGYRVVWPYLNKCNHLNVRVREIEELKTLVSLD